MKIMLNNRHKAGLFLTTVVAGLCLIMGESFRETIGVLIIGLALSWALGSEFRALRWAIALLSLLTMLAPLIAAIADHNIAARAYSRSVDDFRARIPSLVRGHPDLAAGIVPRNDDPYAALAALSGGSTSGYEDGDAFIRASRTLDIPNVGQIYFPSKITGKEIAAAFRADKDHSQPPAWYLEALDEGIDPAQITYLSLPKEKPKALDVGAEISDGVLVEVPSAILATIFLISLFTDRRRHIPT